MIRPFVSVYIPTKNRKNLLLRAFKSVIEQTYKKIEIIIIDDGSTDGTAYLLKELSFQYSNLKVISLKCSVGAPTARNFAIKTAQGELITGLDDDDYFLPNRIKNLVDNYDAKYAFVCSGYYWNYGRVKRRLNFYKKIISLDDQLYLNYASNQVLVEKKRIIDVGGYDSNFVSCQDWELWTRIIKKYGNALRINAVDYVIDTSHGNNRITDNPERAQGFLQFKKTFNYLMNQSQKKSVNFHYLVASGQEINISKLFPLLFTPLWLRGIKYWLSCKFPYFAQKRLEKMK
ncbi:MAG: glycosyl transferase family 2 [Gammaproteobacteria bacterium]|nr:MAG: glycosyl transferase family 2 [Gammaproteobacteria bacterium]